MPEDKPIIGLTWEPKLPTFGKPSSSTLNKASRTMLSNPTSELIDGLYVLPNNPTKVNQLLPKQIKNTTGKNWFDMPAPVMTPELKLDLQTLQLRSVMDPKRHYKRGDTKSKTLPKFVQTGTVLEAPSDYIDARIPRKERKSSLAAELLSDPSLAQYRKRKVREIEEKNRPGGNEKWKINGKHTLKRAKDRRHPTK